MDKDYEVEGNIYRAKFGRKPPAIPHLGAVRAGRVGNGDTIYAAFDKMVGGRCWSMRKDRGIEARQFADRLGCHMSDLRKIETGLTPITLERAKKIAEALGVSVASLVAM